MFERFGEEDKKFLTKFFILTFSLSIIIGFAGGIFFNLGESAFDRGGIPLLRVSDGNNSKSTPPYVPQTDEENITVKAVEQVSPAVASIIITKEVSELGNFSGPNIFPFDDFFEFGFPFESPNIEPQPSEGETRKQQVGGGSGFIITSDGFIVTNRHVVSDEKAEYTVLLSDGRQFEAKVLGKDTLNDLAVIKIEAEGLPTAVLGNSDSIRIGQTVIAIGNALGEFRNTVTKGVISGINRRVVAGDGFGTSEVIEEAIQTDAAINPGNSGGPLINLDGEVIAVNTAISREGQLVGFAIPINVAKNMVESVKKYGKIVRPWIGVRYIIINDRIAAQNNLSFKYGALIVKGEDESELAVIPGSPADKAGLEANDIILEVNGEKVTEEHSLGRIIARFKPGDAVTLKVFHNGEEKTITITLEEFKNE